MINFTVYMLCLVHISLGISRETTFRLFENQNILSNCWKVWSPQREIKSYYPHYKDRSIEG